MGDMPYPPPKASGVDTNDNSRAPSCVYNNNAWCGLFVNMLAFSYSDFGENLEFLLRRHLLFGASYERIAHVLSALKNYCVHASHFSAEDGYVIDWYICGMWPHMSTMLFR
jgi:hypothetical protein